MERFTLYIMIFGALLLLYVAYMYSSIIKNMEKFENDVLTQVKTGINDKDILDMISEIFNRVFGRNPSMIELDKFLDVARKLLNAGKASSKPELKSKLEYEIRTRVQGQVMEGFDEPAEPIEEDEQDMQESKDPKHLDVLRLTTKIQKDLSRIVETLLEK
jgi:hypothetical protein